MIRKLFRQMLLTQILSAMTVTLCMLIDSIMIGRFLGVDAMTAYGLASPVLLVFAALGSMISAGVQVLCGKTMGAGDRKATNSCFSVSVFLAVLISVVGLAVVLIFTSPITRLLGATEGTAVFGLAEDYLRGFIIGAPAFICAQIMVPYMQMSGTRTRLVAAVAAMTVGDVVLDLVNVMLVKNGSFSRGMLGMGLASSFSYYIAVAIGIVYFFKKDCIFRFSARLIRRQTCARIFKGGIPTVINQFSLVLLVFFMNMILLNVGGNLAVAAYSIISTVGNLCYAIGSGTGSVALMLSSIFYTDEDKTSVKELVKTMSFYALMLNVCVTAAVLALAGPLVSLFLTSENALARDLAVFGLRLFVLSMVPSGMNTAFKNFYQGIERVRLSEIISVLQNFALPALFAFLLSRFLGTTGAWLGFLCGEGLTLILMSIYVFAKNKSMKISEDAFALLPQDFGVRDEDRLEVSVTTAKEAIDASVAASDFCLAHGISKKVGMQISLCIEEMVNNILEHGFNKGGRNHSIDVRLLIKEDICMIRIRDNCVNFDPVKYLELHKHDDPFAHIGTRMVMAMVKDANYVNSLGLNNLTLTI